MSKTKQELDAMWAALRPLERAAVVAFRATGVKAQAARFVGRDARGLDKQQRRRPSFAQAMDSTELTVQEARAVHGRSGRPRRDGAGLRLEIPRTGLQPTASDHTPGGEVSDEYVVTGGRICKSACPHRRFSYAPGARNRGGFGRGSGHTRPPRSDVRARCD